jgi:hypothetical protein
MSMHTQLIRGLLALPVAAMLFVAAAIAPPPPSLPCDTETADVDAPALPRTVEFRTMLPGAINLAKRVRLSEG